MTPRLSIWKVTQQRLATRRGWEYFRDEYSLANRTIAVITAARAQPVLYDTFLFEQWLRDVSELLDRCLAYRRDIIEIEAVATKQSIDLDLAEKQAEAMRQLEVAFETTLKQKERQRDDNASTELSHDASALGRGLKAFAQGNASVTEQWLTDDHRRQEYINTKYDAVIDRVNKLRSAGDDEDNALNYNQRKGDLLKLYEQDLSEAYLKARATRDGLIAAYPDVPLFAGEIPTENDRDPFTAFVLGARNVLQTLEIEQQHEIEFEVVVHLRQQVGSQPARWTNQQFQTARENGLFNIDLTLFFPAALSRMRVRGVGLSFSGDNHTKDPNTLVERKLWRLSAVVFAPGPAPRVPAILSNVRLTDPANPVSFDQGPGIVNANPVGVWVVKVGENVGFPDTTTRTLSAVEDLKLHLLLRAKSMDLQYWPRPPFG